MKIYDKLIAKEEKIAVVGLGYVGLPIAIEFAKINSLASLRIFLASKIDRFWIPNRCLGEYLIAEVFFCTAIKINSIGLLWYQIKYFL